MMYQQTMAKRTLAIALVGMLAAVLGVFALAQPAYADFVSGNAQGLGAVAVQDGDEGSGSGTGDGTSDGTDEGASDGTDDGTDDDSGDSIETTTESTNVYRMYNPNSGEHFYTGSFVEAMSLSAKGWNYEGVGWVSETADAGKAVYRLYNPNAGDHHYTKSAGEKDHLVEVGWNYEGISFYAADADADGAKPVYRQYNPNAKTGAHNFTLSTTERDYLVQQGWNDEEVAWYAYPYQEEEDESIDVSTQVFRVYNPNSGEHFFTAKKSEVASLVKTGWKYEKAAWMSLAKDDSNAVGCYRLYNKKNGDHHYTADETEKDNLVAAGWTNEGVSFYCAAADAEGDTLVSIYRLYNPSAANAGSHFFTPSTDERDALVELGWKDEGVSFKALSA